MLEGLRTHQLQQYNLRLLLYVGLLLSETQLLYNLTLSAPVYSIPNFCLFYFLTSTCISTQPLPSSSTLWFLTVSSSNAPRLFRFSSTSTSSFRFPL